MDKKNPKKPVIRDCSVFRAFILILKLKVWALNFKTLNSYVMHMRTSLDTDLPTYSTAQFEKQKISYAQYDDANMLFCVNSSSHVYLLC